LRQPAAIEENSLVGESGNTRWSNIRAAAEGDGPAREEFARRYSPVICAYLGSRWRNSPLITEIPDAAQDVFVEFLRENGPLSRVDSKSPGGFRAYLFGVVRNVARRIEREKGRNREHQPGSDLNLGQVESREDSLSRVFDRAWARSLLRLAAEVQARRAREGGAAAQRRLELLRLRFFEGKPIREIAAEWEMDPGRVHYEYVRARNDFKEALRQVVLEHDPIGSVEKECTRILRHISG
jgi:RNA polymerase sigma-70 factor (ECF subfamily)